MGLLFGSDPEVFVCETIDSKDYAIPVPHFIYNKGIEPVSMDILRKHPVMIKSNNFSIMMDGVAFEFTLPPVKVAVDMYKNIHSALDALAEFADKFDNKVVIKPTVNFDFNKYYDPSNDLSYQCCIFGCDPDLDAILVDGYDSPEIDVKNHPYRYGGGHFHISDGNEMLKDYPLPFVKFMAITCGNYSLAKSIYPELEKQRAWKYGQPARYRIQHYPDKNIGVEYRSPSNFWISELETIEGMFYWAEKAYYYLKCKREDIINDYLEATVEAISSADQSKAQMVLDSLE